MIIYNIFEFLNKYKLKNVLINFFNSKILFKTGKYEGCS